MKIRDARTGEFIVIEPKLPIRRKREVFRALGLEALWPNRPAREAMWAWYCAAPIDEVFIRTGYEVRIGLSAVLVPKHEYMATVPLRRGDRKP